MLWLIYFSEQIKFKYGISTISIIIDFKIERTTTTTTLLLLLLQQKQQNNNKNNK